MLHAITGVQESVQHSLRNAIIAFEQNNNIVRHKLRLAGAQNEIHQEKLRSAIIAELRMAQSATGLDFENGSGDFYVSQNPRLALVQSAMNQAIEQNAVTVPTTTSAPFEQFGPLDPGWIECLVDAFQTLFLGKAPFVQHRDINDFMVDIPDRCKVALVADWGALDTAAMNVASQIRSVQPDVTIHLGDIYYAGQRNETEAFLKLWPMADSATHVIWQNSSFAMNGNHEMYSGGRPYFGVLLTAFGQKASYFGLRNPHWQLLGFDTAYVDHRLLSPQEAATLDFPDNLVASQWTWLADKIRNAGLRKSIFLSHHQPLSSFQPEQDRAQKLQADYRTLVDAVGGAAPFAWFFGHEHKCTIYDDTVTGFKARLIGNGCIPHSPPPAGYVPPDDCVPFTEMNLRQTVNGDAVSGFALLTVDGARLSISYINEDGSVFHEESWD